jgi:hypothetical protein
MTTMKKALVTLAILAASLANAQTKGVARILPSARTVAMFTGQEHELIAALQQNDKPTLDRLVSDDLQVWTPNPAQNPMARAQWLDQVTGASGAATQIRQLAVRDLGHGRSLVSFVLARPTGDSFVVDVWQQSGAWWKLSDRYISRPAK